MTVLDDYGQAYHDGYTSGVTYERVHIAAWLRREAEADPEVGLILRAAAGLVEDGSYAEGGKQHR